MILYEVNLLVQEEVKDDFQDWLVDHIKEMLDFRGFLGATIFERQDPSQDVDGSLALCVHYRLQSMEDLEHYFQQNSKRMRSDAQKRFGEKFSITRRIFSEKSSFEA